MFMNKMERKTIYSYVPKNTKINKTPKKKFFRYKEAAYGSKNQ